MTVTCYIFHWGTLFIKGCAPNCDSNFSFIVFPYFCIIFSNYSLLCPAFPIRQPVVLE